MRATELGDFSDDRTINADGAAFSVTYHAGRRSIGSIEHIAVGVKKPGGQQMSFRESTQSACIVMTGGTKCLPGCSGETKFLPGGIYFSCLVERVTIRTRSTLIAMKWLPEPAA
jgi:hypothetical protein